MYDLKKGKKRRDGQAKFKMTRWGFSIKLRQGGKKFKMKNLPGGESNPGPLRFLDDKQR